MMLITGGAGFIGTVVVRHIINKTTAKVVNVDKLTYAGNVESTTAISDNYRYYFVQALFLGVLCKWEQFREKYAAFDARKTTIEHYLRSSGHADMSERARPMVMDDRK